MSLSNNLSPSVINNNSNQSSSVSSNNSNQSLSDNNAGANLSSVIPENSKSTMSILATARVKAGDNECTLLLDSGSEKSYVTSKFVK